MALTPHETFAPHAEDESALKAAEALIDKELTAKAKQPSQRYLWIAVDPAWSHRVVAELVRRYQAAGWRVRRTSEPYEGDMLRFEPRTSAAGTLRGAR